MSGHTPFCKTLDLRVCKLSFEKIQKEFGYPDKLYSSYIYKSSTFYYDNIIISSEYSIWVYNNVTHFNYIYKVHQGYIIRVIVNILYSVCVKAHWRRNMLNLVNTLLFDFTTKQYPNLYLMLPKICWFLKSWLCGRLTTNVACQNYLPYLHVNWRYVTKVLTMH